jgi:hypothetical protein
MIRDAYPSSPWTCFDITLPTALRETWISSAVGATYTEIL